MINDDPINYKEMYKEMKKKAIFKSMQIKDLSLYNFLNDDYNEINNIIVDCRVKYESMIQEEGGTIRNKTFTLKEIIDIFTDQRNSNLNSQNNNIVDQEVQISEKVNNTETNVLKIDENDYYYYSKRSENIENIEANNIIDANDKTNVNNYSTIKTISNNNHNENLQEKEIKDTDINMNYKEIMKNKVNLFKSLILKETQFILILDDGININDNLDELIQTDNNNDKILCENSEKLVDNFSKIEETNVNKNICNQSNTNITNMNDLIKLKKILTNNDNDNPSFNLKKINHIFNTDYQEFLHYYPFYILNINNKSDLIENYDSILAQTNFPISLIDGILYLGNYFNSKNIKQISLLDIKALICISNEDKLMKEKFKDNIHFFQYSESNKDQIDFELIYKKFKLELDENFYPILITCFTGKLFSVAVCIFILMKYKKLNVIAATAIIMKYFPKMKLPNWLYSQLQKVKV